jgi:hypothetical protein
MGGVGKTRILEEIAARSLDDDFLPVLLRNQDNAPTHPLAFAVRVGEEMNKTRGFLQNDLQVAAPAGPSNCRQLACIRAGLNPTPETPQEKDNTRHKLALYLARKIEDLPEMKIEDVRNSLEADFNELIAAVKNVTGRDHRLLLLLDDLHDYGDLAFSIIDATKGLGLVNIGKPIPLLFTYMTRGGEGIGKKIEDQLNKRPDIRSVELKIFQETEELKMVCRQLLLFGYQRVFSTRRDDQAKVERCIKSIQDKLDGLPKNFRTSEVLNYIDAFTAAEVLVEADYESILRG